MQSKLKMEPKKKSSVCLSLLKIPTGTGWGQAEVGVMGGTRGTSAMGPGGQLCPTRDFLGVKLKSSHVSACLSSGQLHNFGEVWKWLPKAEFIFLYAWTRASVREECIWSVMAK